MVYHGLRGPCSVWLIFQKLDCYIPEGPWKGAKVPALELNDWHILAGLYSNSLTLLAVLAAASAAAVSRLLGL